MNDFKNTLNLPKTKFSMRANLIKKEPEILKKWYKNNIYKHIRIKKEGKKIFLLHDGPPYANGKIHLGHALNKILKDIIIKSKTLSGYNVPFTPTWDCHGLPIEHQIEKNIFKNQEIILEKQNFRKKCRNYAYKQVVDQKKDFIRLGIIADWENSYLTMDFKSEANIIDNLSNIIEKRYIYRGFQPVHWCIECNSSLAEAELEHSQIECKSIFVIFKAEDSTIFLKRFKLNKINMNVNIIIWTTTPWSLIANRAVSVNPEIIYQLIETNNNIFLIAKILVPQVMKEFNIITWKDLGSIQGKNLEFLKVCHPFLKITIPIILSDHVALDMGTGIVHIAPDHGIDDFIVCQKYKIKLLNLVDGYGNYNIKTHPILNEKNVFKSNNIIIKLLSENHSLIKVKKIIHSYPHCWRHKKPTIFRATPQWFININNSDLKETCIKQIKNTKWHPKWGKQQITKMLYKRPDWCISRQRIWGVPIPVFINNETGKLHPQTHIFMKKISRYISLKGIEEWWKVDPSKFLGKDTKNYTQNVDVLDVWFESGSVTISSVYMNTPFNNSQADLYLEGSDQYRGWFMSSLLISIATRQISPYKKVLTHGFIVDQSGRKMSKSIGNTINPETIIKKFGADILRLWVASTNYTKDITVSEPILTQISDNYRKIRNTARFLISNLNDFNPETDCVSPENMILLDKWIVGVTKLLQKRIIYLYENYNFHGITHSLIQFCSVEMSSFYLDIVKDRLYTMKKNSIARKSCQTSMYLILQALVRWIAPILSFTADEIWDYLPGKTNKCIFSDEWFNKLFYFKESEILNFNDWKELITVKNEVNKVLEKSRKLQFIGNSLSSCLILYVNTKLSNKLMLLENEIKFMFITSKVTIKPYLMAPKNAYTSTLVPNLKIIVTPSKKKKCERCWHRILKIQEKNVNICNRCIKNTLGNGEKRSFL